MAIDNCNIAAILFIFPDFSGFPQIGTASAMQGA